MSDSEARDFVRDLFGEQPEPDPDRAGGNHVPREGSAALPGRGADHEARQLLHDLLGGQDPRLNDDPL